MKTNIWKEKNYNDKLPNAYRKLPYKNDKYPTINYTKQLL